MVNIAVIYPSLIPSEERINPKIQSLKDAGYNVFEVGTDLTRIGNCSGFAYGTYQERADIIEAALNDDSIDVIWCAEGGIGANLVAEELSKRNLPQTDKPFIGFSDISNLLITLSQKDAARAIHGEVLCSVVESNFEYYTRKDLQPHQMRVKQIRGNQNKIGGTVFASCIDGFVSSYATDWQLRGSVNKEGKPNTILLLEDIKPPEVVTREIGVLAKNGALANVSAVVIGKCGQNPLQEENRDGYFGSLNLRNSDGEEISIFVADWKSFGHNRNGSMLPVLEYSGAEIADGVLKISNIQREFSLGEVSTATASRNDSWIVEDSIGLRLKKPSLAGKSLALKPIDISMFEDMGHQLQPQEIKMFQITLVAQALVDMKIANKLDGVKEIKAQIEGATQDDIEGLKQTLQESGVDSSILRVNSVINSVMTNKR